MKHWLSYIVFFSIDDLKRQNARSSLGYFWIVLSQFVNIIGIALIYGLIFRQDLTKFFPYVSAGIISWNLTSSYISDSTKIYLNNAATIQNFKFPVWIYIGMLISKSLIIFFHGIGIQVLINIVLGVAFTFESVLIVPNLVLVLLLMFYMGRIFGFVGARFRDFGPAIGNIIYLCFLVTPIIWEKNIFPENYTWLLYLNPFTSLIDLIRSPILGQSPSIVSYLITLLCIVAAYIVQIVFINKREKRIVFYI